MTYVINRVVKSYTTQNIIFNTLIHQKCTEENAIDSIY